MHEANNESMDPAATRGGDDKLVARALAGDGEAFAALLRPLQADLRRYLRSALWKIPRVDPDEIFMDTVRRAWENLPRYDPRYAFRNYIFGIAKMAARREIRRPPGRERPFSDVSDSSGAADERVSNNVPELPADESLPAIDLSGLFRSPPPDQCVHVSSILREMLIALFACGGYPHQQIAFCYSVALWGTAKKDTAGGTLRAKVPITGDPDQVVRSIGGTALADSGRTLRVFFEEEAHVADEDLDQALQPFWYRLGLLVQDLFARDKVSARAFGTLGDTRVADTRLEQYFGKNPRKSIADWTDGVKANTHRALCGTFDRRRTPLPFPEESSR